MKRLLIAMGALAVAVPSAQAATVIETVNLDGRVNGSLDGTAGVVSVLLNAGTYSLKFVDGLYSGFSRWSSNAGCSGAGTHCRQGYENSARYVIGGVTYGIGDNDGLGTPGPHGEAYYASAAQAIAAAAGYSATFTLTEAQNVQFYLRDNVLGDNRGGVSLAISAVPEPATWAMMILGFGVVGAAMRRRKTNVSVSYA